MKLSPKQLQAYQYELDAAAQAQAQGKPDSAFAHLERAHIIGQRNVAAHTRAHWHMLKFGIKHRDVREILGQLLRIPAAISKTLIWVPRGNTGGANVSALKPMPVPTDLQHLVD